MASRYMTTQRERKLPDSPSAKKVGGVGDAKPKAGKKAGSGFPTCTGSGGEFGAFERLAFGRKGY